MRGSKGQQIIIRGTNKRNGKEYNKIEGKK
jgi:hypothetical protein